MKVKHLSENSSADCSPPYAALKKHGETSDEKEVTTVQQPDIPNFIFTTNSAMSLL